MSDSAPMDRPLLRVIESRFPGRAVFDTAVSHAALRLVARGERPATARLYVPDDIVVFSLTDARLPGFGRALEHARRAGFGAVLRLGGGHAAAFTRECLAFSYAVPARDAHRGIAHRFDALAEVMRRALVSLGVAAEVGPVPGEYCPGDHSIGVLGRHKLVGIGQRVIRGAAHLGGFVVLDAADRVREVLEPVYAALELDWDPASAGAVSDHAPGLGFEALRGALVRELGHMHEVERDQADGPLLALAETLCDWHDPGKKARSASLVSAKTLAVPGQASPDAEG